MQLKFKITNFVGHFCVMTFLFSLSFAGACNKNIIGNSVKDPLIDLANSYLKDADSEKGTKDFIKNKDIHKQIQTKDFQTSENYHLCVKSSP